MPRADYTGARRLAPGLCCGSVAQLLCEFGVMLSQPLAAAIFNSSSLALRSFAATILTSLARQAVGEREAQCG